MPTPIHTHQRLGKESWRQLVVEFQSSGQVRHEFSKARGVSGLTLARWVRYFRREASPQTGSPFMDLGTVRAGDLTPVTATPFRFEVRLDLGGGVVLALSRT